MIIKIATLTLNKSDKLAFLIEQLKELQTQTQKESGCETFIFYQHKQQLNTFILFEQFKDQTSLDVHLTLAHTQNFFSFNLVRVTQITPLIELT
ncbi:MAG: antibiotic biosynthesis monooxygenase [Saccharospirillaceae bacterium]|nr:antibiotic biosynthesis monooxygenase [Pseudomonadales bacterium]NRB77459.1 antibiotic biosynthesis monooxygenase [Saccharospirillaceae bacterium]